MYINFESGLTFWEVSKRKAHSIWVEGKLEFRLQSRVLSSGSKLDCASAYMHSMICSYFYKTSWLKNKIKLIILSHLNIIAQQRKPIINLKEKGKGKKTCEYMHIFRLSDRVESYTNDLTSHSIYHILVFQAHTMCERLKI